MSDRSRRGLPRSTSSANGDPPGTSAPNFANLIAPNGPTRTSAPNFDNLLAPDDTNRRQQQQPAFRQPSSYSEHPANYGTLPPGEEARQVSARGGPPSGRRPEIRTTSATEAPAPYPRYEPSNPHLPLSQTSRPPFSSQWRPPPDTGYPPPPHQSPPSRQDLGYTQHHLGATSSAHPPHVQPRQERGYSRPPLEPISPAYVQRRQHQGHPPFPQGPTSLGQSLPRNSQPGPESSAHLLPRPGPESSAHLLPRPPPGPSPQSFFGSNNQPIVAPSRADGSPQEIVWRAASADNRPNQRELDAARRERERERRRERVRVRRRQDAQREESQDDEIDDLLPQTKTCRKRK